MKKIKVLAIAGVFTASLAGAAFAEMADVKIGGEIRVRAENVKTDGSTGVGQYLQRTRINVDAKVNETTKAYISLQDSRVWGSESAGDANGDGKVDANELTGTTGDGAEAVDVSQAYFQLDKLADQPLSLRVGRQALAYGDHRLVGSFEWSNNARRFDALKIMYNTDAFGVDLWTAKVVEGGTATASADTDFNGLYATVKSVPNNAIDLYLLQNKTDKFSTTPEQDILTYGVRVAGKAADLDYGVEFALQTGDNKKTTAGTDNDQDASAYAIKAGYTIPAAMGLRIGAEYDFASGDNNSADKTNEAFNNLYPTNHYLYGFNDDTGWSNIKATALSVSAKPADNLSVAAEYWMYTLAEKNTAGKDDNGTELNLMARYKLNPNVALEAAYVSRAAGDINVTSGYAQPTADKSGAFTYLQANVTF